jgi:hypothetical protein
MKETYCHYSKKWIPLGRARTRCPKCGAEIGMDGFTHNVREKSQITGKCEIRWCKSNDSELIEANENIGDGCYRVLICQTCAEILNVKINNDLPEPSVVERKLKEFRR